MPGVVGKKLDVFAADLNLLLASCGATGGDIQKKPQVRYLIGYLSELKAKTAVIEYDYIDRDYMEDYARYYARCFKPYKRKCQRIHFFDCQYSLESVQKFITGETSLTEAKQFADSYLGFIVIRPLPWTFLGRSCLVPYRGDPARHYEALCDTIVSFFGRELSVRSMPFQEQDSAVAACATCALWSSFQITSKCFRHAIYTPGHITTLATGHGLSFVRNLPNTSGLSLNDVVYAIRHVGLDPVSIKVEGIGGHLDAANGFNRSIILGNIYAYLSLGISVVALGDKIEGSGSVLGGHAVAINGYHLRDQPADGTLASNGLSACRIDKLYLHDDQIGPYVKAEIVAGNPGDEWTIKLADPKDGAIAEVFKFRPKHLVVPVYEKIRVSYEEVWRCAYEFDRLICALPIDFGRLEWKIALVTSNGFKTEVREDRNIRSEDKLVFLATGFPKYLWNLSLICNGRVWAVFCMDATDSGQGLDVAGSVFYSNELPGLVQVLCDAYPMLKEVPLCRACILNEHKE